MNLLLIVIGTKEIFPLTRLPQEKGDIAREIAPNTFLLLCKFSDAGYTPKLARIMGQQPYYVFGMASTTWWGTPHDDDVKKMIEDGLQGPTVRSVDILRP